MNLIFFSKERKQANLKVPSHSHKCFEIIFYGNNASGHCIIDKNEYTIKPYCVAVIHKDCMHSETHLSDTTVSFIGIEDIMDIPQKVYYNMYELKVIFSDIKSEMENQNNYFTDIIVLKTTEILLRLKRTLSHHSHNTKGLIFFKNYIDENYMNSINIKKLSELSGYSYDHFRHLFAKHFQISPQKYIMECRIKDALKYLTTTNLTCTEIAYSCGFTDASQMTKIIKKKYNKTPLQIRNNK